MHPTRPNTRPFLKAFGLALPVVAVIVVWAVTSHADPEAAGEVAGGLSVAPLLGGLAVGIWAIRAPRRWYWPDYALRFVLCTAGFFGLNALGRGMMPAATRRIQPTAAVALTDAEKQGLSVSYGWVQHSTFDFVLPVGPQFEYAPDVQNQINQAFAGMPGAFAWVLQAQNPDRLVMIFVAKGMGNDRTTFRAIAQGVSSSAGKNAAEVLEDELVWNGSAKEFRYVARLADGRYAQTRCLPSASDRKPPYVVCVQTLGPDRNGLDPVRNQFEVRKSPA